MTITLLLDWLSQNLAGIATIGATLFAILGVLSALEAIMKSRTAQGAVAWAIVLVGFPPLFVPLYWVFGRRRFRGYAVAKREDAREFHRQANRLGLSFSDFDAQDSDNDPRLVALPQLASLPFTGGNSARLLIDGNAAFADIFEQIRQAKEYILLEFYIVRDDEIGRELAELLLSKAAEGLSIYFIYDEIGSLQLPRHFVHRLRQGGIDIRPFNSTKGVGNRLQLNFRNHRKIVVTDGAYAAIGGMNIGDEYRHKHPRLSPWRDTGLAITGPAVQAVQLAFAEDWYWATEQLPTLNWTPKPNPNADNRVLILPSGPADNVESCALFFHNMINQARHRLWIVSPYFVPDPPVIQALQLAAMRGVDVRIMLPDLPDKLIIKLSSYTAIRETLPQGVQFYYYQKGFLHQKVLLVDDDISSVGTANLDNRSLRLNFEISAVSHDRDFARQVEAMLVEDFRQCIQLLPKTVAKWSLPRRILSRCAYLFAPVQ